MFKNKGFRPFFFAELIVTGIAYLDLLKQYLMLLLQEGDPKDMLFEQNGMPPHFHYEVRGFLGSYFPGKWIGRSGNISWPSHSPDLISHFFL